jgi:hypothetical protein
VVLIASLLGATARRPLFVATSLEIRMRNCLRLSEHTPDLGDVKREGDLDASKF